ncbi:MAG: lipopolysaccharide biosynthesis protein [Eggerthellaceae bacterium]|nr:lipopolysaccharide biosynthesis protein [Eggerthellaceae bacterium]
MDRKSIKREDRAKTGSRASSQSKYRMAQGSQRDTGSIHDAGRSRKQEADDEGVSESVFANMPKRVNPVRRLINEWFDRLVGAVSDGSLSGQDEEYASGRTSRDFAWNTVGFAAWGMVFPILTIVVTGLAGVERAGMFSFSFVMANLLYILASYGVRTYQVSDISEFHSFSDYQANRIITCALMVFIGLAICNLLGYTGEMFVMSMGIFAFKAIDAFGEVYEGRLQQVDKLYLGGISLSLRSLAGFLLFSIALAVTGDLGIASIAMAVAAACTLVFLTIPLTMFETPKSLPLNPRSVRLLFQDCFPVFLALFLYAVIDNMPKFVMQGAALSYDNQLYFNALYFPAQAILITVGMIYKPLLVKLANVWADESRRNRFDAVIIAMMALIVGITVVGILFMNWIGIPIMSFMYGLDFEKYKQLSFIMLAAGGVTAAIDFLYQVITILRRQQVVLGLYLITFGFSLLVLILMTTMMKLQGAVVGYLIVMSILLILLVREYVTQRIKFSKGGRR